MSTRFILNLCATRLYNAKTLLCAPQIRIFNEHSYLCKYEVFISKQNWKVFQQCRSLRFSRKFCHKKKKSTVVRKGTVCLQHALLDKKNFHCDFPWPLAQAWKVLLLNVILLDSPRIKTISMCIENYLWFHCFNTFDKQLSSKTTWNYL